MSSFFQKNEKKSRKGCGTGPYENPVVWLHGIPYSNLIDTLRERVIETRKHNRIYEIN